MVAAPIGNTAGRKEHQKFLTDADFGHEEKFKEIASWVFDSNEASWLSQREGYKTL
ncbi:MAG: hypothetical protein WCH40_08205 [Verrucomicrobiales bacterium]